MGPESGNDRKTNQGRALMDVTMVIFRPDREVLRLTIDSLGRVCGEFAKLWLLVSGSGEDREFVDGLVVNSKMAAQVVVRHRFDNLGFASGHNWLMDDAFASGADSVLVLNPDMCIERGSLQRLLSYADSDGQLALYGPSLRRLEAIGDETPQVDSMGIGWSATGRHWDVRQGRPWSIVEGRSSDVAGISGACLLVSRRVYSRIVGFTGWFFDDAFLAYREDAELGIRARRVGVGCRVVETEGFSHRRAVRGYRRGQELPDLLGARNRFIMAWRLGNGRPGCIPVVLCRDLLVILAARFVERSSWPGVASAFAIRRYIRYGRVRVR